jgi:hypothetical protein
MFLNVFELSACLIPMAFPMAIFVGSVRDACSRTGTGAGTGGGTGAATPPAAVGLGDGPLSLPSPA